MFGRHIDFFTRIAGLLKQGSFNGMHATIFLKEAYMEDYGIASLDDNRSNSVMPLVSMNNKEGLSTLSPYHRRLQQYRLFKIYDNYHLSLVEFLNLPKDIIEYMLEEIGEETQSKAKADAAAAERIKQHV